MTDRARIIEMAMQADLATWHESIAGYGFGFAEPDKLERFAALVRAQVLEQAAQVCERMDEASYPHTRKWPSDCAAAIRALKDQPGHSAAAEAGASTAPLTKLVPVAPLLAHADDLERCATACDEEDMPATAAEFRKAAGEIRALVTDAPHRRSLSGDQKPDDPVPESGGGEGGMR